MNSNLGVMEPLGNLGQHLSVVFCHCFLSHCFCCAFSVLFTIAHSVLTVRVSRGANHILLHLSTCIWFLVLDSCSILLIEYEPSKHRSLPAIVVMRHIVYTINAINAIVRAFASQTSHNFQTALQDEQRK